MVGNLANYSNLRDPENISMLDLAITLKEFILSYFFFINFNIPKNTQEYQIYLVVYDKTLKYIDLLEMKI